MANFEVSLPELATVAATRGMAGIGIGLLLAGYLQPQTRKSVGLTLLAIGGLSTLPLGAMVMSRRRISRRDTNIGG
jgi:hypothetical protein